MTDEEIYSKAVEVLNKFISNTEMRLPFYQDIPENFAIYHKSYMITIRKWGKLSTSVEWDVDFGKDGATIKRNFITF